MEYSPVSAIRIKNFRNIGDIKIDFSESPIISLLGDNEAGKTSVIKAIGVLALNAYPMDQKRYIRDGTIGFGIEAVLEDGTTITRIKKANSNSYNIVYPDKTIWTTDKIDKGGIPVKVVELMGMLEEQETKEFLHIRTYEEQLLFVLTKSSTNYKVMYDALKVANITYAIKKGSQEVNSLKSDIRSNEASMTTLNNQLRATPVYDIEPAILIRERLKGYIDGYNKLLKAKQLVLYNKARNRELASINTISSLEYGDIRQAEKINEILDRKARVDGLEKKMAVYSSLSDIRPVNLLVMDKLNRASLLKQDIEKEEKSLYYTDGIRDMQYINTGLLDKLDRCLTLKRVCDGLQSKRINIQGLQGISQGMSGTVSKLELAINIRDKIKSLSDYTIKLKDDIACVNKKLKDTGVKVATCPNCGETVIME